MSTPAERDALARTQDAWQQLQHAEHGRMQIHHRVAQQIGMEGAGDRQPVPPAALTVLTG